MDKSTLKLLGLTAASLLLGAYLWYVTSLAVMFLIMAVLPVSIWTAIGLVRFWPTRRPEEARADNSD